MWLSVAGAVHETMRLLPAPCVSASPLGVFGADVIMVNVWTADQALTPAAFEHSTWTSTGAPAVRLEIV